MMKYFNYLHYFNVKNDMNCKYKFMVAQYNSARQWWKRENELPWRFIPQYLGEENPPIFTTQQRQNVELCDPFTNTD